MSQVYQKDVKIGGKNGIIIWVKLCADGPKDPKTNEPLIDPETGEDYPGPNDDMAELLHDYLVKIRGPMNLPTGGTVPRFGVLSLLAMKTPIFCYDHPRLKKIANTAFTDGRSIFVDADFMRKLVDQEKETGGKLSGMLFLLMHELMHKLFAHVGRLKNIPPKIANIAEDLVINGKLVKGFDTIKPVPLLYEVGVGMKPEEAEKYHSMSEEVVAEMLMRQEFQKKKKKEQEKKKQQQQKQKGGGGSGQPESGDGDGEENESDSDNDQSQAQNNKSGKKPSKSPKGDKDKSKKPGEQDGDGEGDEDEQSQNKGPKGKQKNEKSSGEEDGEGSGQGDDEEEESEYSPIHHISPEELLEALEEAGLEGAKEALGMPDSDNVEELGRMKERNKLNIVDAIQTAQSQAMNCSGKYPGKEISQAASDKIGDLDKGKIIWKLALKKLFQGDGQKLFHSDDEAAVPWYLDKDTMGIDPFYIGSPIPQAPDESVLVLVDTSGSTGGGTLRKEFLQEALGIKKSLSSLGDSARKVFIYSADTAILGEPVEVTDMNIEKLKHDGVPIFDGGGTDFANCLNQALGAPVMKKEKIKAVVYFTDCYDAVPRRADFEEHLENGVKIVFVTTPGLFNEKWNQELTWAEVYCMEDGTKVDLGKDINDVDTNTRKNRLN